MDDLDGDAEPRMKSCKALRSTLSRVLTKRWKQEPPPDLTRRIEAEEDRATLQNWVDEAVTAKSFAAFRKAVGL